jgi:5,10-methylenetetrahydrofolate reductase
LFPGAAVSPFKYTEASQMQQYYKMEKKVACGAEFLITQVGWDWRKSAELFTYLREAGLDVPVIGNVYLLSTLTPAPRLMHDIKLPGCFVSDELLAKVNSERVDDHIERAGRSRCTRGRLAWTSAASLRLFTDLAPCHQIDQRSRSRESLLARRTVHL